MVMKEMLIYYIKIFIVTAVLLVTFVSVNAAENNKNLELDFKLSQKNLESKIEKTEQALNINIYSNKNGENPYLYLYQVKRDNWTNYEGISIHLENKSNKNQNINLQIESSLKNKFKLKSDATIFLKNRESKSYRKGKMSNLGLEVPSKFKGEIYIVFDNFVNEINNTVLNKRELENIISWGLNVIPLSQDEGIISLNKVELLSGKSLSTIKRLKDIKIIGSDEVQIPMVGESIESYRIEGEGNIKYFLLEKYEGITLNQDGVLTVSDKAMPKDIILKMKMDNEIEYEKIITVVHSWSFNKVDKDGVPYKLLPPDKSPTVNEINKFIFLEKFMMPIKVCLITTCFICLMLYVKWRH